MNGLPIVLIHGYPLDHTMWYSTIAALGSQARVICVDLPGFGREPVLEEEPSMEAYANWIARVMDENEAPAAVVAGMSMGGYIALALAELAPNRVAGLGLVSTQSLADSEEARKARGEMIERIRKEGPGVAAEGMIPKFFGSKGAGNADLEAYVRQGAARAGVDGLSWALAAMAARKDRTHVVKEMGVPVMVVHGAEDKIVPVERARQLADQCRLPIMVELKGVGHASPLEAPDHTAQALAGLYRSALDFQSAGSGEQEASGNIA